MLSREKLSNISTERNDQIYIFLNGWQHLFHEIVHKLSYFDNSMAINYRTSLGLLDLSEEAREGIVQYFSFFALSSFMRSEFEINVKFSELISINNAYVVEVKTIQKFVIALSKKMGKANNHSSSDSNPQNLILARKLLAEYYFLGSYEIVNLCDEYGLEFPFTDKMLCLNS